MYIGTYIQISTDEETIDTTRIQSRKKKQTNQKTSQLSSSRRELPQTHTCLTPKLVLECFVKNYIYTLTWKCRNSLKHISLFSKYLRICQHSFQSIRSIQEQHKILPRKYVRWCLLITAFQFFSFFLYLVKFY